jgi:hypothetical protein
MNMKWKVLLGLLFAFSIAGVGVLSAKMRAQEIAFERLSQDRGKLRQLQGENVRLQSAVVDPIEVERLRRETAVLLKLRNEFGKLMNSSAESAALETSAEKNIEKLLEEREEILVEEEQIHQLSARATCIKNLEQIASAKARWGEDNAAESGLPVTMANLVDYLPGHTVPVCPTGGHYSVNRTGAVPVCSVEGHSIP